MFLVAYKGTDVSNQYQMACMINALTREQLQRFTFRPESDSTLEEFKTVFSEIFFWSKPKQFADLETAHMRDNETSRAFLFPLRGSCSLHQDQRQSVSTVGFPQKDVGIQHLEGYSGHDRETVVQLQRQTTP